MSTREQVEERNVWIFFYGTFMDPKILADYGISSAVVIPARVSGYELRIRPRVNLVRSDSALVYGSLFKLTHDEIRKLYANLEQAFGLKYLPEAVLTESLNGNFRPALCCIAPYMEDSEPKIEYLRQMATAVRTIGLPEYYAVQIESLQTQCS